MTMLMLALGPFHVMAMFMFMLISLLIASENQASSPPWSSPTTARFSGSRNNLIQVDCP